MCVCYKIIPLDVIRIGLGVIHLIYLFRDCYKFTIELTFFLLNKLNKLLILNVIFMQLKLFLFIIF